MQPSAAALCPTCGADVRPGWRVCPACERRLSGSGTATQTAVGSGPVSSSISHEDEGRFPAGTVLAGRYRIVGLLGRGGMGEVYRAYDLILNQPVALKFLTGAKMSEAALARFRNEVRTARQVSHPNVCRVYDIGSVEGLQFLSMEYVDGEDLDSLLLRIGRLPQDKAIEFARKICAGLAAAHERGVLHRDLKPANIMIDGRGQVRITDFGLAALAAEIPLSDLRSGTPAYMSPEQKAGKEVTARSDLFSLGLVFYEMFTGRRRSDTQSDPSEIVTDLDPAIERLILRCLEQDSRRRPNSALSVAMALPGGDPVAAALAAGETPSPEMVAASTEKEGFTPRTAAACLAIVLASLVVCALLAPKTSLAGRARPDLPPDALAFRAQDILRQLGYTEAPRRTAYGYDCCPPYFPAFLDEYSSVERDAVLASHRPPVIYFWYRQHRADLLADQFLPGLGPRRMAPIARTATVTPDSPANTEPGMIRMFLDAKGRLVQLEVRPWELNPSPEPAAARDGTALWNAAGLDAARFQPAAARAIPPMAFDASLAWTGTYAPDRRETVMVEAAYWRGRPVFFQVGEFRDTAAETAQRPVSIVWILLFVIVLAGSTLTARRNLRLGRGDRRSAAKLAMTWFLIAMAVWAANASHVANPWEFALLIMALSWAAFIGGILWLLYVAVEPYIRRHWPDSLISWTRFQAGQIRNPLVASHVLAGITVGMGWEWLVHHPVRALVSAPPEATASVAFSSVFQFLFVRVYAVFAAAVMEAMGCVLVVVLLRLLIPRLWAADLAACVIFGVSGLGYFGSGTFRNVVAVVFVGAICALWLTVFRRFGLLSLFAGFAAVGISRTSPLLFSVWYGGYMLALQLSMAAIAAWCVWVIASASERRRMDAISRSTPQSA